MGSPDLLKRVLPHTLYAEPHGRSLCGPILRIDCKSFPVTKTEVRLLGGEEGKKEDTQRRFKVIKSRKAGWGW